MPHPPAPPAGHRATLEAAGGWERAVAEYDATGLLVLPAFLSAAQTAALRQACERLFETEGTDGMGEYANPACRRLGNLFVHGEAFERLATDPLLLALAQHTVLPGGGAPEADGPSGVMWQALNAHDPLPGDSTARQPIHADRAFFPECTGYFNVIVALQVLPASPRLRNALPRQTLCCPRRDELTVDNGAPRAVRRRLLPPPDPLPPLTHSSVQVPGSHRWDWPSVLLPSGTELGPVAGEVRLTCPAGGAICCHGEVWHGGMANYSDGTRLALHLGFACPHTRPQYGIAEACSAELRERLRAQV